MTADLALGDRRQGNGCSARHACAHLTDNGTPQARWHEVSQMLRTMGFEVGWGSTVGRVKESMHELLDILQVRVARGQ